jgi:ABC-type nitrate/sulfonate/bicarbonate transport system substrate-binding protein
VILSRFAEKYGVKVEATPMRRYADLQLALTTNQVDVAVIGYVNVGLMEEAGFQDYKVVSGVFTGAQSLTLAKDVKATTWKDLEGKTLGTAPNSYAELLFKATAKANGADLAKIKTVSFAAAGPPMLAALKNRDIDGFVAWEPNNADAALGNYGYYSTLDIAANETRGVNGVLAVNSKYAADHPDVVLAVVKALIDSTNHLNSHEDEYAEIAQRATGSAMPIVRESMKHGVLDYRLYQKEGEALLKLIHEAGITKKPTAGAIATHFDYQYLSKATGKSRTELGGR